MDRLGVKPPPSPLPWPGKEAAAVTWQPEPPWRRPGEEEEAAPAAAQALFKAARGAAAASGSSGERLETAMPQEGENQKQENWMPERTEYYLEFLLTDAFKGKGFQKIAEILDENDICPPQKCSKQLLNQLDKILKKELDKNEFANVSLLLKCIQQYCRSDPQESVDLLLQQGLIPKISNSTHVCQTREFLNLIEPKESKFLISLVEDFLDTALIIGKSNTEGKKQLLETFLPYLGHLTTESNVSCGLRQEALRTLNTLLDSVSKEERMKFAVSEEMCLLTKELTKVILDVGDYDIQSAIMEALFRLMLKKWRDDLAHSWFEDQNIAKIFREIKYKDFETDCRKFLNELNEKLGDKRSVCSIPCKAAYADMNTLKKPADDKLEEFWIDFNFGSKSLTFYLENPEGTFWESVRLSSEEVSSCYVQEEGGEKILKMLMKIPTEINKKEATQIKIHFDSEFDISALLGKALGKEKMMERMNEDDDLEQNGTVNSTVEWKKDLAGADSLSDILTSNPSDQSVIATTTKTAVLIDVAATRESQQTEKEHDSLSQASTDATSVSQTCSTNALEISPRLNASIPKASPLKQKDKTVVHSGSTVEEEPHLQSIEKITLEDHFPERKNKTRNSCEQITEAVKDPYDFGNVSDSVACKVVTNMKQKVLAQNATLSSSEKKNAELSKSEKRLSSSYKKHLFSESNYETQSNSTGERSWILDSQKKPMTKSADYTRRKMRTRSSLKVLPLSSPSSDSDHHAKKTRSSAMQREKMKGRMSTEMHNFSTLKQSGFTSTPLNTGQYNLEMGDATLPLSRTSSPDYSDTGMTKKYEVASTVSPLANTVSKCKRKLSDFSAGLNRKRSKCAERESGNEQSSSIPFKPRKLFNSTGSEEVTQKDQNVDELENDVFVSKTLEEEFGDSGVIAAFENFTSEMKKSFWTRCKRMEIYTQSVLKVPEHNISALLNRIHQCRMNELERFQKIVVQELDNLEKRTRFLLSLEKETMEFWTKQSNKLNSKFNTFCNHQIQRIQSFGSVLDETTEHLKETVQNFEKIVDQKEEKSKDVLLTD